jgi:hypothetical protein
MRRTTGRPLAAALAGALLAAAVTSGGAAQAAPGCATGGPASGAYTVTVCLAQPADGATVAGAATVAATVTRSGAAPNTLKVVFTLDGEYVLSDFTAPYQFGLPSDHWTDGARTLRAQPVMADGFAATAGTAPPAGQPLVVAAVGDAAGGKPNNAAVADLIASWSPNLLLYLGDVYDKGGYAELTNWYDATLGRFRAITDPTIGNHEYYGPGTIATKGYFYYWRSPPHAYSFDAAGWHVVSLDANVEYKQLQPGTAQYQWLAQDLAASRSPCTLVFFHEPRWSVGEHGSDANLAAIWSLLAGAGVDLVLNGHDHGYQRWLPLDGQGQPAAGGVTELVVGTGGSSPTRFASSDARVAKGIDTAPQSVGALRLELGAGAASYRYVAAAGQTLDSGSLACAADTTPPSAPGGLQATASAPDQVDLAWTAASDDVGVTGYDLYRDGSLLQQLGAVTSAADPTAQPGTTYSYTVRARDAAGNVSAASDPATVTTPAQPPPLFADGFESGSLAAWTSASAGMTVQAAEVHSGAAAARATGSGTTAGYARKTLAGTYPDLYYRAWVQILAQGANSADLLKLQTAAGSSIITVFVDAAGHLKLYNDGQRTTVYSPAVVGRAAWHEVQLHATVTGGAGGQVEVWLDGTRIPQLSVTQALGSAPIGRLVLGNIAANRDYDLAFDDVAAATTPLP